MDSPQLIQKLVESFTAVANELQTLTDRKTILEHKLRYAHEQYQALADKYAPCAPDIAETIAKLQVPPTPTSTSFVPLPSRLGSDSSQAQLALFIREGKKVARQLQAMADASMSSTSMRDTSTKMTTELSTVLEKDFTVEGKKGPLQCPFSSVKAQDPQAPEADKSDHPTPHPAGDPICAALIEENTSAHTGNGGAKSKCPIRYMDKHTPEEIARYVETHKHELPRSHEVCLRRNQKNEEQIRKLDAKYGNLVSMIEDLSYLHAPMLPEPGQEAEPDQDGDVERTSDRRVSDWAQNVSASAAEEGLHGDSSQAEEDGLDRTSHFDRLLKPVRVGESPSRPWGISVPIPPPDVPLDEPTSPAAPVRMPSPAPAETPKASANRLSKCPFDHTKMRLNAPGLSEFPKMDEHHPAPRPSTPVHAPGQAVPQSLKQPQPAPLDSPPPSHQPTFINTTGTATATTKAAVPAGAAAPQMVFNGPVFIGYPMADAIQFLQQFQGQQPQQ